MSASPAPFPWDATPTAKTIPPTSTCPAAEALSPWQHQIGCASHAPHPAGQERSCWSLARGTRMPYALCWIPMQQRRQGGSGRSSKNAPIQCCASSSCRQVPHQVSCCFSFDFDPCTSKRYKAGTRKNGTTTWTMQHTLHCFTAKVAKLLFLVASIYNAHRNIIGNKNK